MKRLERALLRNCMISLDVEHSAGGLHNRLGRTLVCELPMSAPLPLPAVSSPCIKICMLDTRGICVGCGRDLDEIANWSRMTPEQQREVCRLAQERKQQASGV